MRNLSPRQTEIAQLVMQGLTEPEIAERLVLSLQTVKNHKQAIYRSLGVNNSAHMAAVLSKEIPDLIA